MNPDDQRFWGLLRTGELGNTRPGTWRAANWQRRPSIEHPFTVAKLVTVEQAAIISTFFPD
jgi:hypothetical protein